MDTKATARRSYVWLNVCSKATEKNAEYILLLC